MVYITYDGQRVEYPAGTDDLDIAHDILILALSGRTVTEHDTDRLDYAESDVIHVYQPLDRQAIIDAVGQDGFALVTQDGSFGYAWLDAIAAGDPASVAETLRFFNDD